MLFLDFASSVKSSLDLMQKNPSRPLIILFNEFEGFIFTKFFEFCLIRIRNINEHIIDTKLHWQLFIVINRFLYLFCFF